MPPRPAIDICTNAMYEIGALSPGDVPSSTDTNFVLDKLNKLLDEWNARKLNIFAYDFLTYTLIPSVQPLTIGQAAIITAANLTSNVVTYTAKNTFRPNEIVDTSGCINSVFNVAGQVIVTATPTNFTTSITHADIGTEVEPPTALTVYTGVTPPNFPTLYERPVQIDSANILLTNATPLAKVPLFVHNGMAGADYWANVRVPQVLSTIPTDLYYAPQFPNGQIYLWPMQSFAYGIELWVFNDLPEMVLTTTAFVFPQGYENAITYSLAESICPAFNKVLSPTLAALAVRARSAIQSLNSKSPTQETKDSGIPSQSPGKTYFNWLTGGTTTR
jgi:hypothetical protein